MEQLLEFAGNNLLLSGAFVVVLVILIATELNRATRKFRELSTNEAIRRMNKEDVVIVDVSGSADFGKGHILGSVNMPPTRIEAGNQQLMRWKDRPILVVCKNGQVSPQMAGKLTKMGFSDVAVLGGGLVQWRADNQPVTTGHKPAKASSGGKKDKGRRKGGSKSGKEQKGSKKKTKGKNDEGSRQPGPDGEPSEPADDPSTTPDQPGEEPAVGEQTDSRG